MANITDFKSRLANGGARANQFAVSVPLGGSAAEDLKFLCKGASLPSSTIQDIPILYRGREVHVAGERTFEPWTITIINETNFAVRTALELWMNAIQSNSTTTGLVAPYAYQRELTVVQLGRNEETHMTYNFANAYPTNVSEIQLSYDQGQSVEEFNVTFTYDYWTGFSTNAGIIGKAVEAFGAVTNAISGAKAVARVFN